jgi:uncharacterized protein YciI/uncharacterized protein YndB with AHSA1/START domain
MNGTTIAPLRREVRVRCDQATAFELFTAHIGAWWPLRSHSVHGSQASVAFEDGRLVERVGTTADVWGTVLAWDRPRGFRMTWHPGHPPEPATEVAVSFEPDGEGTLVTLVHSGWERLPLEGYAPREEYEHGWPVVLGHFVDTVAGPGADGEADGETDGEADGEADGETDGETDGESWFALHHRPGTALAEGGSVFAHPLFGEHVAFLGRLRDRGWLVAAGPVSPQDGVGMTVVRLPTEQGPELVALAREDDRSVAGGLLTVDVEPWDVRFTG